MPKSLLRILACLFLLLASGEAFAASKTYYSKATATASGVGKVYVSTTATSTPEYGSTNTVTHSSESTDHTYYFYAQPNEGKVFLGWYDGNSKLSEEQNYTHTLSAGSTDETKPTTVSLTGRFADNFPYVTVKSDWATVTISSVANKLGQKININTQQPWTIEGQVNMAYGFDGWYDQDGNLFSEKKYTEFTIDRELDLEARWSLRPGQLHGTGYYRCANMFNDYVKVVGNQDIDFNMNETSCAPDLVWFSHPLHFYYGYSNGAKNNAYGDPGIIIYVEGTLNEANSKNYSNQKTDVMTDIRLSAQGVVANDHMKGYAEGKPMKITWSGANENQYHLLGQVGSTYLAFKYLWGEDSPAVKKNNSDTFDDLHILAVDEEHIDTNWFAAFPDESMWHDGGYWSTMYTAFPYQCYAPDGVEAYYVSELWGDANEKIAVLTRLDDGIVPPHTPVLLKSPTVIDLTAYYTIGHADVPEPANRLLPLLPSDELEAQAAEIAKVNALQGSYQLDTETKATANSSIRILGETNGEVGFYRLADGTELLANRAWLNIGEASAATKVRLMFDDDVAGLDGVRVEPDTDRCTGIYDLNGRKVERMVPGHIYIVNGRKRLAR